MMSWPGWAGSLCSKSAGAVSSSGLWPRCSVRISFSLNNGPAGSEEVRTADRFDDEGVQLIVGLVVVVGAPTFGCVVHPESELDFVRHCLLLAKWDDHSPALAAIAGASAGEGLHKAEVAAVREAEPVQLGYRVQLSFMRPVLGCWDSFDERHKGDVLVGGICLGPAGSPTSRQQLGAVP